MCIYIYIYVYIYIYIIHSLINMCIYSPNKRSEEGFLLAFNRIAPEFQDFPSSPTCLVLPSQAPNSLNFRIARRPVAAHLPRLA